VRCALFGTATAVALVTVHVAAVNVAAARTAADQRVMVDRVIDIFLMRI
jgi:hypothetical protein